MGAAYVRILRERNNNGWIHAHNLACFQTLRQSIKEDKMQVLEFLFIHFTEQH